jgi:hypothetical protein
VHPRASVSNNTIETAISVSDKNRTVMAIYNLQPMQTFVIPPYSASRMQTAYSVGNFSL